MFHAPAGAGAGPLAGALADARAALAEVHRRGFLAAGAIDVRIIADSGARPFGTRLREVAATLPRAAGLVVLGSGSLPLATAADRRSFVSAATGPPRVALANNRYSGDAVAIPDAARVLAAVPDLPGDNALPRWLAEHAGLVVADLRDRRRLQADLDGPADLALLVRSPLCPASLRAAAAGLDAELADLRVRLHAVASVAADRRAELLVAGRLSAAGLAHLEVATSSRVRALVEERGLRASSPLAVGATAGRPGNAGAADGRPGMDATAVESGAPVSDHAARPPASVLEMLLDRDGPSSLGTTLARLGDAALVDTRVLLAGRLGADERAWPTPEDRFASDLGLEAAIVDPWLRMLTEGARTAPIPVVLGGHSLVGPGLWLLFPRRVRLAGESSS